MRTSMKWSAVAPMASVRTVITKMKNRSQEYGRGAVVSDMVMHPFRLFAAHHQPRSGLLQVCSLPP